MTIQIIIVIDFIHSQMTIQLIIYIVKSINDYTIDYIHSQMTIQLTIYNWLLTIHSQMTIQMTIQSNDYTIVKWQMNIQLTIYIVKWLYNLTIQLTICIVKWLYNWLYT